MEYHGKLYAKIGNSYVPLLSTSKDFDELKIKAELSDKLLEKLNEARVIIGQMKRSILAHPDHTEGSEFDDFTSAAQEIEDEIETLLKDNGTIRQTETDT